MNYITNKYAVIFRSRIPQTKIETLEESRKENLISLSERAKGNMP